MIVPVTKDNEKEWAGLCAALWPHHTAGDLLCEKADGRFQNEFLHLDGHKAVAFVSLSLRHDYVEGTSSSGYLEGLYVKPAFRRRGIARALVNFAWSLQKGCAELASDCLLANEESRLFHRSAGFAEANTIVCFALKLSGA